jgi:hypothetical protein
MEESMGNSLEVDKSRAVHSLLTTGWRLNLFSQQCQRGLLWVEGNG